MRKKDLLNMPLTDVPEELISSAMNDKYMIRQFELWSGTLHEEKSYGTRLYFGATEEKGILIIRMWPRAGFMQGKLNPISVTYIDVDGEKWITRKDGRWTEAMLENIRAEYTHQPKTFWKAQDISTKGDTDFCNRLLGTDEESVYEAVKIWQEEIRSRLNLKRAERRKADWDRMMNLLPEEPEDFREWAAGEGTISDNFLLFKRNGRRTEVYCTNCGKTFETTEKMRHNKGEKTRWDYRSEHVGFCRNCRHTFDTKSWRKQRSLQTESWVVLPQAAGEYISMRSYQVRKKFEKKQLIPGGPEEWKQVTTIFENMRIFTDTKSFESKDSFKWEVVQSFEGKCFWRRVRGRDYSGKQYPYQVAEGKMYMHNADEICVASGMKKFIYERCQGNQSDSPQRLLIAMAKKKYLEYLFKAGLNRLAEEAIKYPYHVELNEDATDLKGLLGINGQKLRIMKDIDGHYDMIPLLNEIEYLRQKVDIETLRLLNEQEIWFDSLPMDETGMSVQRIMNYIRKQAAKQSRSIKSTLQEYRDYLRIAEQLGYDTRDEIVCRTPDLKKMHDRYSEYYNRNKDAIRENSANRSFWQIAEKYGENKEHFGYEKEGLTILVPERASDIIREGREQHHCVGASDRYMERMDKGESYILFLRKKEEPKKPYYTLEVTWDGKIRQSYGEYDRKPDEGKINEWLRFFTRAIKKRTEREKAALAGKAPTHDMIAVG